MSNIVLMIPAYNPLPTIIPFVQSLQQLETYTIIIINDGSDEKCEPIFTTLRALNCIVLEHQHNEGKGKALKTGFYYMMKHLKEAQGVITVGAHNQHRLEDVQRILETTNVFDDGLILAVRQFKGDNIPMLNIFANRAATLLFQTFFRKRLLDIQSGLRYIPMQHLYWLKKVHGKGFNYDTNMLVEAIERKIPIYEVPIGEIRVKKNSVIFYDEIIHPSIMLQQIWQSFRKRKI